MNWQVTAHETLACSAVLVCSGVLVRSDRFLWYQHFQRSIILGGTFGSNVKTDSNHSISQV